VRRKGVEIAVERFEVDTLVRHRLGAVDERDRAARVGQLHDFTHRQDGAQGVRDVRTGDDARPLVHVRGDVRKVDDPTAIHRHVFDHRSGLLGDELPGHDVRVVFEGGQQNFIAAMQAWARIGLSHEIDGFGGAAREDDLARRAGIDECAHPLARVLEHLRRFLAQLVHAAMHIGVMQALVVVHGGDDTGRPLRGRGAVEKHQRLAVNLAREDREIAPHAFRVVTRRRCRIGAHVANSPSSADTSFNWAAIRCSISARNSVQSTRDTASSMKAHCSSVCAVRRSMPRDSR
jgi:hypothetical protein